MLHLKLDGSGQGPIYKQIAAAIEKDIESGRLPAGYKLPTVRELSSEMGVACGTIKHAYEHLEERGFVAMVQGSGSFVLDRSEDTSSRKEQAMAAIDGMFHQLERLGFTPREMEIYLNLKLRGLEEKYDVVKVAVVDCNPETLQLIEKQLSQIGYAETAPFALSRLEEIAPKLNSDYDVILTTSTHFAEVEPYINQNKTLAMMAMTPAIRTTIQLAKVGDEAQVGIFCASDAFSQVVRTGCLGMGSWSERLTTQLMGMPGLADFLEAQDVVIVPEGYDAFISKEERSQLAAYRESGGHVVGYDYKIDRGSFLYVEAQIKKCMNKKRSV